jgi:hypothetical protein
MTLELTKLQPFDPFRRGVHFLFGLLTHPLDQLRKAQRNTKGRPDSVLVKLQMGKFGPEYSAIRLMLIRLDAHLAPAPKLLKYEHDPL